MFRAFSFVLISLLGLGSVNAEQGLPRPYQETLRPYNATGLAQKQWTMLAYRWNTEGVLSGDPAAVFSLRQFPIHLMKGNHIYIHGKIRTYTNDVVIDTRVLCYITKCRALLKFGPIYIPYRLRFRPHGFSYEYLPDIGYINIPPNEYDVSIIIIHDNDNADARAYPASELRFAISGRTADNKFLPITWRNLAPSMLVDPRQPEKGAPVDSPVQKRHSPRAHLTVGAAPQIPSEVPSHPLTKNPHHVDNFDLK